MSKKEGNHVRNDVTTMDELWKAKSRYLGIFRRCDGRVPCRKSLPGTNFSIVGFKKREGGSKNGEAIQNDGEGFSKNRILLRMRNEVLVCNEFSEYPQMPGMWES